MTPLPLIDAVTPPRGPRAEQVLVLDGIEAPDFAALVMPDEVVQQSLIAADNGPVEVETLTAQDVSVDDGVGLVLGESAGPKPDPSAKVLTDPVLTTPTNRPARVVPESVPDQPAALPDQKEKVTNVTVLQAVVQGKMPSTSSPLLAPPNAVMRSERTPVDAKTTDGAVTRAAPDVVKLSDHVVSTSKPLTDNNIGHDAIKREPVQPQRNDAPASVLNKSRTPHAPPQIPVPAPPVLPLVQEPQKQVLAALSGDVDVLQSLPVSERVGLPVGASTVSAGPPPAAEMARHATQQIASAVIQQQGRATEIALNPEELGRVRLSMTAVDAAITLSVAAERPETADLLRRHIDVLTQEFRALGYEDITFSFGGDGQSGTDAEAHLDGAVVDHADVDDPPHGSAIPAMSGLDLRL